jgi:cephalosporin hydroxylase
MAGLLKKKGVSHSATPNPGSTEFEIDNWQLSELVINHIVPVAGVHPFPLNELLLMCGTVARFRPKLIFEWGTHIGKSARIFYEASEVFGTNTEIHSIDLPDEVGHGEHPRQQRGYMVKGIKKVNLHQGDGLDTALELLKTKKNSERGEEVLFFIDGDHSYESVKRELSGIMTAAPKAVILIHDSFYQSKDSSYNTGPHRAISDCLNKTKSKYKRIDTATGLPGMTLLYPPR